MAKRKRWGPGNPLWEWQQRKRKPSTTKRSVKKLARRRSRVRRFYGRARRFRTRRDNRIPILPAVGVISTFVTPTSQGESCYGNLKAFAETGDTKRLEWAGSALLMKYTGLDLTTNPGTVAWRPMDMLSGLGAIVAGSIGSMVATRVGANRMMKKIPVVGRYIKL